MMSRPRRARSSNQPHITSRGRSDSRISSGVTRRTSLASVAVMVAVRRPPPREASSPNSSPGSMKCCSSSSPVAGHRPESNTYIPSGVSPFVNRTWPASSRRTRPPDCSRSRLIFPTVIAQPPPRTRKALGKPGYQRRTHARCRQSQVQGPNTTAKSNPPRPTLGDRGEHRPSRRTDARPTQSSDPSASLPGEHPSPPTICASPTSFPGPPG